MTDLARWRDEFPILSRSVYMISNSLGAMPRAAARSLAEYADTWATRGVRAWEERWWELAGELGARIEAIIGAPAGSVSMHENVTTAEAVALSCIRPEGTKRTIVCTAMDFPSAVYLYKAQRDIGFDLHIVPALDDLSVPGERIADAIDDRTAAVCLSHVLFRSSYIVDPAPVIEKAHAMGVPVILDGYQSAGIIPVDVTALGVDFFVGGCLKWLCGGPGNAFLYTAPWVKATSRPRFTGWLSRADPFAFDIDATDVRDDGMAMMNGTPAIPAYYAALPGLEIIGQRRRRSDPRGITGHDAPAARSRGRARVPFGRLAGSRASRGHRGGRRARGRARGEDAQRPRFRRGLPARRRHPPVTALLQHDGRDRRDDARARSHRPDEGGPASRVSRPWRG